MSSGPERASKRGSRCVMPGAWRIGRLRETAFFEESSVGACLEVRWCRRWSFLPARRSAASPNGEGERRLEGREVKVGRFRLRPRDAWAAARAPKEMSVRDCCGEEADGAD